MSPGPAEAQIFMHLCGFSNPIMKPICPSENLHGTKPILITKDGMEQ